MGVNVPEKLRAVARDIAAEGSANLTRLAVMKKWFEPPHRLAAFAVWVARRSASTKRKGRGPAARLLSQARRLLRDVNPYAPRLDRQAARALHERLWNFQNDLERQRWGPVRIIRDWDLLLVEEALAIYLGHTDSPSQGYRLAADLCRHDDARYGCGLSGPSRAKILATARFMTRHEAREDQR